LPHLAVARRFGGMLRNSRIFPRERHPGIHVDRAGLLVRLASATSTALAIAHGSNP
jgi:hypothetical protein